ERSGRRAGGRVFEHAESGPEHARLPAQSLAGDAVDADGAEVCELLIVGTKAGDLVFGYKRDEDVLDAVVVELDGKLRLDAEHAAELIFAVERRHARQRLLHASEDD